MPTIISSWEEPGRVAIEGAVAAIDSGSNLLTSLEKGLATAELDPSLLAIGLGSFPNADGELELDAAIMEGRSLNAGSVCAVRGIVPVISVARLVMEQTPHVMLAGDQARRFAISNGFKPTNLMTANCIDHYNKWCENPSTYDIQYLHSTKDEPPHDTVTMLGVDESGHCVAASSTSGWAFKMPGRVGDSPIIGAGIYADDEVGCAGATGLGEELWKACASFRTVEAMRRGLSAQQACEETIKQMIRRQPGSTVLPCVVMAISKDGSYGAACSKEIFPMWTYKDGVKQLLKIETTNL